MTKTFGTSTILLGDDDLEVRGYLEMALRCQGHSVEVAEDGEEVLSSLQGSKVPVSAVLLDMVMPRKDGLETLREIRRMDRRIPVIMISGASAPDHAAEAIKLGATDFLSKPVSHEDLRIALDRALREVRRVPAEILEKASAARRRMFFSLNSQMIDLESIIDRVGWSEAPILIQGETGSGKEVLARELHDRSPRSDKPFLKLNCAALPAELVESELFGYERGAFTGAFQRKPGMFELADKGTLMLDEIGDMDVKLQAKLLQVLQDQEFQRLGGRETIRVDVRVVAATHRDLEESVLKQTFREDLYYRLNVINLRIPPLRERKEDIIPLAEFLLKRHVPAGTAAPALTTKMKEVLASYRWPGNVRELENVVRRYIVFGSADQIVRELQAKATRSITLAATHGTSKTLKAPAQDSPAAASVLEQMTKAKEQAESDAILSVLSSTCWNRKQAAVLLNIDYKALLYKMKKLGIEEKGASGAAQPEAKESCASV